MENVERVKESIKVFLDASPVGQKLAKYPISFIIIFCSSLFHIACLSVPKSEAVIAALAVSPSASLMSGKLWTFITSALVEDNTLKFAIYCALVSIGTGKLEEEWGSVAVGKLLGFSTITSSLASSLLFIGVYMSTLNDEIFFSHVYGLGGLLVTVAVAMIKFLKTSSPETPRKETMAILPIVCGYAILGLRFPLYDALLVVFSFIFSIWYLSTEQFTFKLFVPDVKLLSSTPRQNDEQILPIPPLPSTDPSKERFRARGFKLLDKKLAELEATPEISLDGEKVEEKV